jgi:predicted AlkP superfamily phosphohydrolase/phosphomutase
MTAPPAITLIGLDSADFALIRRWAEEGCLPTFRRLFAESRWGKVVNPIGFEAGSVWPTFATGFMPDYHGQFDGWHTFDRQNYTKRKLHPNEVPIEPLWRTLSRAGKQVAVIDIPYAFMEDSLNGVQVADWLCHVKTIDQGLSTIPSSLAEDIRAKYGTSPFPSEDPCPTNPFDVSSASGVADLRDRLIRGIQWKTDFLTNLLGMRQWDLFLSVFTEAHDVGHKLWHIHDPLHEQHDSRIAQQLGDPLRDVYTALDEAVGRLLAMTDPDSTVIIYCSHGIGPERTASNFLDDILLALETAYAGPPSQTRIDRLRQVYRAIVPKIIRDKVNATKQLKSVYDANEASRIKTRRFFELTPNQATGGVRFNVIGRERYGRVTSGRELQKLCARLANDIHAITNLDTGKPLVDTVMLTDDVYTGPMRHALPDMLLEWNKSGPIVRVHSPLFGTLVNRRGRPRTGDHVHKEGVFFARGPGIPLGQHDEPVRAADFAPTIAALLHCGSVHYQGHLIKGLCH